MPPAGCSPAGAQPVDRFAKDQFRIDLAAGTVTCLARITIPDPAHLPGWGGLGSAPPAASARSATPAPAASTVGWSPSTRTRPSWLPLAPANATPTTGRPGQESSTSSRTCCALATAADVPACGGWSRWLRTSSCSPPRQPGPLRRPRAELRQQRLAGPAGLTGDRAAALLALAQHAELLQPIRHHPPRPSTLRATGIAASLSICVGLSTVSPPSVVARPRQTNTQNSL
jgi:hypothetical protein